MTESTLHPANITGPRPSAWQTSLSICHLRRCAHKCPSGCAWSVSPQDLSRAQSPSKAWPFQKNRTVSPSTTVTEEGENRRFVLSTVMIMACGSSSCISGARSPWSSIGHRRRTKTNETILRMLLFLPFWLSNHVYEKHLETKFTS